MSVILDSIFGDLQFDAIWTGRCEVFLFGEVLKVELIVQTFDDDPISDIQRVTFQEFESNKRSICHQVEQAVFDFYRKNIESYRECFDREKADVVAPEISSIGDLRELVSLRSIKVMTVFEGDERQIGFVFDATFDPELGVGVLLTNGCVEAVETQDFLLG
jgi:hypothetical protein